MNQPDPKQHQLVSFLKSAVRITGYLALPFGIGLGVTILVIYLKLFPSLDEWF